MKLLTRFHLVSVLLLACCLGGCAEVLNHRTLKLAHGLEVTHPVHIAMEFMAKKVEEKSGGKLRMDIYPGEQLGSERQLLESLQIGSIGMTKVSSAVLEQFDPNIRVLGLPYIFKDRDHHFRVLDGEVGQELLLGTQKYWLRGLCYYDAGSRSFYSRNRRIDKPEDLSGMRIRVQQSQTAMAMIDALGAKPEPIAWGELYTSLQQGRVDGAENNAPSFLSSRHYEVCKYYSLNEHTAVPDVLIMSTHVWNRLSAQEQAWLMEAVNESLVFQRELWAEKEAEALKAVEAAGVEIIRPDKQPFMDRVAGMFEDYRDETEMYDLIKRIQAVD